MLCCGFRVFFCEGCYGEVDIPPQSSESFSEWCERSCEILKSNQLYVRIPSNRWMRGS